MERNTVETNAIKVIANVCSSPWYIIHIHSLYSLIYTPMVEPE